MTNKSIGFELDARAQRMFGYGNYDRVDRRARRPAVAASDYISGDRFTAADVYVGATINWGTQFGTLPSLDSFLAYSGRVHRASGLQRGQGDRHRPDRRSRGGQGTGRGIKAGLT